MKIGADEHTSQDSSDSEIFMKNLTYRPSSSRNVKSESAVSAVPAESAGTDGR